MSSKALFLLTLLTAKIAAQTPDIDSLTIALTKSSLSRIERIDLYNALGSHHCQWMDSAQTQEYCTKAINLSHEEGYLIGVARATHTLANFHLLKGNLEEAEKHFNQLILVSYNYGYLTGLSQGYNGLGTVYSKTGNYRKALQNLRKSLTFYDSKTGKIEIAKSFKIIGQVYFEEGFIEEAKAFTLDAKRIFREFGKKADENCTLIYLAKIAIAESDFDLAKIYLSKVLHSEVELRPHQLVELYDTYGNKFMKQGQLDSARKYFNWGLKESKRFCLSPEVAALCVNLGQISLARDSLDAAKTAIASGITKNNQILFRYPEKYQDALSSLAQIEYKQGNFQSSASYFKEHKKRSDSLDYKKDLKYMALIKADMKYKSELDSLRLTLKEEKIIDTARQERNQIAQLIALVIISLLSLLLVITFRFYKSKQSSNLYLDRLTKTQSKLFGVIAHDIRNPMNVIHGLLDLIDHHVKKKYTVDEDLHMMNKNIKHACSQVVTLFEDLLQWSMKNQGKISFSPDNHSLQNLVENSLEVWCTYAELKQIEIITKIDSQLGIFVDKESFITIIRNLVGNALKFTPKNGTIQIIGVNDQGFIKVMIIDSGVGIELEKIKKILSTDQEVDSENGTEGEEGTGFGLDLVKDFVKMNKGALQIESEKGSGTTINIMVPSGDLSLEMTS